MTGVILAGGNGTRLRPLTLIVNKHLLPVYDKPMITYPIKTLKWMGCSDIIIISGGEHIGGYADYLKDGTEHGVSITYRVQPTAGGIAQALACVQGLVKGLFPVILGDNYFQTAPIMPKKPTLYTKTVDNPERFGVYFNGAIIEKPSVAISNDAVVGLYVYDDKVFDYIQTLKPSARGELEITDVNNIYLSNGADVVAYRDYWSDMGTFESLMEVANYEQKAR